MSGGVGLAQKWGLAWGQARAQCTGTSSVRRRQAHACGRSAMRHYVWRWSRSCSSSGSAPPPSLWHGSHASRREGPFERAAGAPLGAGPDGGRTADAPAGPRSGRTLCTQNSPGTGLHAAPEHHRPGPMPLVPPPLPCGSAGALPLQPPPPRLTESPCRRGPTSVVVGGACAPVCRPHSQATSTPMPNFTPDSRESQGLASSSAGVPGGAARTRRTRRTDAPPVRTPQPLSAWDFLRAPTAVSSVGERRGEPGVLRCPRTAMCTAPLTGLGALVSAPASAWPLCYLPPPPRPHSPPLRPGHTSADRHSTQNRHHRVHTTPTAPRACAGQCRMARGPRGTGCGAGAKVTSHDTALGILRTDALDAPHISVN